MRTMLPSLPDDDILPDIPHLRGYHELVRHAGAQLRGQEPQANDRSFGAAHFPDLADQDQIDQRAVDRSSKSRRSMPIECSWISTKEYPSPWTWAAAETW